MSVRREKRRDPATGAMREFLMVDVDFVHPDGRQQRVRKVSPVQTRRGAEQYERELRDSLMAGRYGKKEEQQAPMLADFAKEFVATYAVSNNKHSEVEAKQSILRSWIVPAFGKRRLDTIGLRDVEALKADMLRQGLSAKRVNNTLTVLGRLLKYATEIALTSAAPRIKFLRVPPQELDFLDYEEYGRLVSAAEAEPDVQAAIITAGDAGLRSGEIRALKWGRLDLVARRLTVAETFWRRHLGSPKGGRIGTLPMTETLTSTLRSLRHLRGEFVFCHDNGDPWSRDWADKALKRQCRRAGLREITWHVLRHTFCSHLAMQGAPAKAIMELARHTSLGVTQRYMHLSPDARREAINLLDARPQRQPDGNMSMRVEGTRATTRS